MDRARRWRPGRQTCAFPKESGGTRAGTTFDYVSPQEGCRHGSSGTDGRGGNRPVPPLFFWAPRPRGGLWLHEPLEDPQVAPIAREEHPERVSAVLLLHHPEGGPRGRDGPRARVGDLDLELPRLRREPAQDLRLQL